MLIPIILITIWQRTLVVIWLVVFLFQGSTWSKFTFRRCDLLCGEFMVFFYYILFLFLWNENLEWCPGTGHTTNDTERGQEGYLSDLYMEFCIVLLSYFICFIFYVYVLCRLFIYYFQFYFIFMVMFSSEL